MNVRKHLTAVTVTKPVDGRPSRSARQPREERQNVLETTVVPSAALEAALALAGGDLSRLRPVPAPDAIGGVALVVYNSAAEARRAKR